jgi:DNA-binding NarL/FixJ family response regulator
MFYIIESETQLHQEAGVRLADRFPPAMAAGEERSKMLLEVNADLIQRLERLARSRRQSPQALASRLLAQGLEDETRRSYAEMALQRLTPRQQDVALLTARGLTNRQIAERLIVSTETVKTHVRHVLDKLDLASKADLRLILARLDQAPPGEVRSTPRRSR